MGKLKNKNDGKLIVDENDEIVEVEYSTYKKFFELMGGAKLFGAMVIATIFQLIFFVYQTYHIG